MGADHELLQRWRGGDAGAREALFDRHFPALLRFFRNKAEGSVEDLVQATMLALVESRDRYRGDADFRAFMFGVARNVLHNHYRARLGDRTVPDVGRASVADLAPGASTLMHRQAEERLLLQAMRTLPLDEQIVLELYYWERMRAREIAEALGDPEGSIRTRIRRAKELVRKALEALTQGDAVLRESVGDFEQWAESIRLQWRR